MEKPSATLEQIITLCETVLADGELNPQQVNFLNYIRNSAKELHSVAVDIPPLEHAIQAILPVLGDSFNQPLVAIFGYAKLLIEQPESFGNAALKEKQKHKVKQIFNLSMGLYETTQHLKRETFEERVAQRDAKPIIFDLNMVIWQNIPIYRFWLREKAVKITAEFPQGLPPVHCNPYHIAAIAQHIVTTMGSELIEYGNIRISGSMSPDEKMVSLNFFCTGITLSEEEIFLLFDRQGRNHYRKQIEAEKGHLRFSRENGIGATVHVDLPLPPRLTTSQDSLSN